MRLYHVLGVDQEALPLVRCYGAAVEPGTQRYHLLLDDLSETHDQPKWHLTVGRYVTRTIDCLAGFHAYWALRPDIHRRLAELLAP